MHTAPAAQDSEPFVGLRLAQRMACIAISPPLMVSLEPRSFDMMQDRAALHRVWLLAAFLLAWGMWGVIHDIGGSAAFADSNPDGL